MWELKVLKVHKERQGLRVLLVRKELKEVVVI
jgi:hypothetical protein